MSDALELEVAGRKVRVSSPDKVCFPKRGFTKRDVVDYYVAVGDGIMRALRDRPTTLQRFPDGIEGESFYQKRVPAKGVPAWLDTAEIAFPSGRKAQELCPTDLAHVVWAAQMNAVVFHAWPVRRAHVDHPDEMRIDLDPQPGTDFADAARAAGELHAILDELGYTGWPKSSGGRGIHVYVRIRPQWTFIEVRRAVIALARELERRRPDQVTTKWWKEERGEKVFVDFNQANRDRTIASAFSPRPLPGAPVSMPVAWDDLTDVAPADFTVRTVPALVAEGTDPWRSMPDSVGTIDGALEWWERDVADGLPELNFPPDYPKMPGEPPRVQPSKKKYDDDADYLPDEGGYLRDNPQEPPGGWDSPHRRRRR